MATDLDMLGRFSVVTEYFMSRQSWLRKGKSCCDGMLLCRDRVVQHGENLCRDRVFLRRDRKSQDIRFPCLDIALYVMTVG